MPKKNRSKKNKGVTPKQVIKRRLDAVGSEVAALRTVTGSGDYRSALASFSRDLGAIIRPIAKGAITNAGSSVGNMLGSKIGMGVKGGEVGKALGAKLSRLIGSGDYTTSGEDVQVNSLIKGTATQTMSFSTTSGGTRIAHREFIQDVRTGTYSGDSTFNIQSFPINPGLPFSFPYLANIALNYEEYVVHGMIFEFVSSTSPYNSSSAMGTYIMSMEYDAAALPFTNKPQMENSDFAMSARFDKCGMYGVECKSNVQNAYYVRYSNTTNLPLTTTDLGTFYFATQPAITFPENSVIGELWVTYDIEFRRPRISPARYGYAHLSGNGPKTSTLIFDPIYASKLVAYGSLSTISYNSSTGVFSFPDADVGDTYLFIFTIYAPIPTGLSNVNWNTTNFEASNIFSGYTLSSVTSPNNVDSTSSLGSNVTSTACFSVQSPNPSLFLNLTNIGSIPGDYTIDFIVVDLGNGFSSTQL
jgi:hypothetical protein